MNEKLKQKFRDFKTRVNGSSLIKGFFITLFGSGMSKFILVAATFYCTNMLTKAEFGEFSFVRNTLAMILTICASNFSSLCTKFATEAKNSAASVQRLFLLFVFSLAMCSIAGILLEVLPEQSIHDILGGEGSVDYFRVCGLLMPVFMLQPLIEGVLRGLRKFKLIGYIQVGTSVLYVIVIALGIEWRGAYGAIMALYLYYAIYSLIGLYYMLKFAPLKKVLSQSKGFLSQHTTLYKMVLPVFILSFIEAPIFWYLQVLLTKHATVEAVASMTVMKQLRNFATLIPSYFFNTFLAFAGTLNAEKKYNEYFNKFDRFLRLFSLAGLGLAVLLSLCGKGLLWRYSPEYVGDWFVLCISNICIPIQMMNTLVKTELLLQEHQRYLMFISIAWNILWIGVFAALLYMGVAALPAFFISEVIGLGTNFVLTYSVYNKDKRILINQSL